MFSTRPGEALLRVMLRSSSPKHLLAAAAVAGSSLLASCSDPTTEMEFRASIQRLNNGQVELISEVSNFSNQIKTINDIDIAQPLHQALQLTTPSGTTGSYTPIDNTISYTINKQLAPQESYRFRLIGRETENFISGDVDFIINNNFLHFRSIAVSCCR